MNQKNNQPKSGSKQPKTQVQTSRPYTDAEEATTRENQGTNKSEKKGGSAKDKAGFESPQDDPA